MSVGVLLVALLHLLIFQKAVSKPLSFLVVGDWGGRSLSPHTTPAQLKVAKIMGEKAAEIDAQFTLSMGDNFYLLGVKNVEDERFKQTFEDVYTASSLQTPWYLVCGNHDHYRNGSCSAEIAYSKVSNRWNFPDFYYAKEFAIPGTNSSVGILFIDTVILAGMTHPFVDSIPPSGPSSLSAAEEQWAFINDTLTKWASNKNMWKIVAGHYPVWSVAEHGPTELLVSRLKCMLEKNGATAYFCGHDHDMQHLNDSGVQYYVVGAGHLINPSTAHESDVPEGSLKYIFNPDHDQFSTGAFAAVTATDQEFTVTYYDSDGNNLYSATSYKPR